eukprot:TRINITY_DN4018_c0_g1_i1.p1 TRINITY_DN4018_c0_g1~~TRINITY_DN4018_c0_g1_i1.p1  ORF type:complete len:787 (-),score=140.16 TRINITY_DN4018_c0_g1_i1:88-2448(-)
MEGHSSSPRPGNTYSDDPKRLHSMTYSLQSLFKMINQQDSAKGDELALMQKQTLDLKKAISHTSKKNFTLERDIRNLDKKIALLIRNKLSVEEVVSNSNDLSLLNKTGVLKSKRERDLYGELCWLLQTDTRYIAALARLVTTAQMDNLLQTVMFTLYGNQYDDFEEHLLLSMFRSVLDVEFSNAAGLGSVLRSNTTLTRMMTTYTRRGPGQAYLKNTLTNVLTNLFEKEDLVLEINPLKVYLEYINDYEIQHGVKSTLNRKVTAEEAAQNEEVKKIIAPRIAKLDEIAGQFIDAFIKSTENVPYGIRWICRQIRELCREKFPDATREQTCSLIGGFYLLRFINPAIVTPQSFMLGEVKLSTNARRNLTLLAKILQNLANNVKFGGVKEFFMAPLNICIDKNKDRLNTFLEELTLVENLEQNLTLDKYVALSKTEENSINISLNELYFIHDLLVVHLNELIRGMQDPLVDLLKQLGDAPPQVPRKDNANIDLVLHDRSKDADTDTASNKLTPEQIYAETKFLLFTIIKALPSDNSALSSKQTVEETLNSAKKYAQQINNKALMDSVSRIQRNCTELVEVGYLKGDDNYAQLRKDAVQELFNYEEQIEKAKAMLARLHEVLRNIEAHGGFLVDQYEAYKSYLDAVTTQVCSSSGNAGLTKAGSSSGVGTGSTKSRKPSKDDKKSLGPFKYSYSELEKMGIIKESEIPKDKRPNMQFQFSSTGPGVFLVSVSWRSRTVQVLPLELADLLERKQEGRLDFDTDFMKLDVNLLLFLLNKHFVQQKGNNRKR